MDPDKGHLLSHNRVVQRWGGFGARCSRGCQALPPGPGTCWVSREMCIPDKLRVPLARRENWGTGCFVFVQLYPVISSLSAHFPYEIAWEFCGNDFRPWLLLFDIAVNFPGLGWCGFFLPQMRTIPGDNCWHCLPQMQGDTRGSEESASPRLMGFVSGSLRLRSGKLLSPRSLMWRFYRNDFWLLRALYEVWLSVLILNEAKESVKMEAVGFESRYSSSKKELYFKNNLLHVFERLQF